jgi:large subunit ribosomal protein L9
MKVILRENVENLGKIGEVIRVKDGYARNYLIPRKLVSIADEKNINAMKHHKQELERKSKKAKAESSELAKKLEAFSCTVSRKVGENEKLFGSVTTGDIADALEKGGFKINKKMIHLDEPIKKLGVVTVQVKLQNDVTAQLKVWVVQEN